MNVVEWNLDSRGFHTVTTSIIRYIPDTTDLTDSQPNLRLLVLSHQLAQQGTPAFFIDKLPKYIGNLIDDNNQPFVIVFDFYSQFGNFNLPYFFQFDTIEIEFSSVFTNELTDHITRAITLLLYYKFHNLSPCYHSSFLLFPSSETWFEPFILRYVPVLIKGNVHFRTYLIGNLNVHVDSQSHFNENTYVLIPPYEHPFCIQSSTPTQITAKYSDNQTILTFQRNDIRITQLLNPSPTLINIFNPSPPIVQGANFGNEHEHKFCQFKNLPSFNFPEPAINDFFEDKVNKEYEKLLQENKIQNSSLEDKPPSLDTILTEQISNYAIRDLISNCISSLCTFPSKRLNLKLETAKFISHYEITYGLTKNSPPVFTNSFLSKQTTRFFPLGIPQVVVLKSNLFIETPANKVIEKWIPENYKPPIGTKNANFVVFSACSLKENVIKQFVHYFAHVYSSLGFGKLTQFRKESAFILTNSNELITRITSFLNAYKLTQFQVYPIIFFIITEKEFDFTFQPHIHQIHITPSQVAKFNVDSIQRLAFLTYSRIRVETPNPTNIIHESLSVTKLPFNPEDMFFKFRYQHPFCLKRISKNTLHIHACWDPISTISVWSDDIGSVFHVEKLSHIHYLGSVYSYLKDSFNDIHVCCSIGILMNGLPNGLIAPFRNLTDFNLYSIMPAPHVQVTNLNTDEDVFIASDYEQTYEPIKDLVPPQSCGYVVSKRFPAYFLALYYTSFPNPDEYLVTIAKGLSSLSWLTVRPGSEKRQIAYPPTMNLLLQKIPSTAMYTNMFEFLPCIEPI
ncbi:hypothetical protein TRFO_11982 [Tritrichomonas foetus]|uniref:Uncharacterized protein n=1 Tax=Tritrichomonas foetus TaxID=1144522 RepID=A0A1J4J679_9EUKA|nr:hypothetical protein TRFO_11982 [Tritrichomonas foetus]|eukprot:OHS93171.1 hypothetical protein TRFO_11982 [Tritrichomonas foetus]